MAAAAALRQPLLPTSSSPPPDYLGRSSFWSYCFFSFPFPLLQLGNRRELHLQDLPPAPPGSTSEHLLHDFLRAWESTTECRRFPWGKPYKERRRPSILRAIWKMLWKDVLTTAFFALIKGLGVLFGPIFIFFFVDYASNPSARSPSKGIVLVMSLAVIKILENLGQRHWYYGCRLLGTKIQSAMMAAVYDKEFRLSSAARRRHATGEIINYVSVDAFRLCEFAWRLHWSWVIVFIVVGSLCISCAVVGAAATVAADILIVAVLVALSPLMRSMQAAQRSFMTIQDERLRRTTEILQGIRVIKLQAWEDKFDEFIKQKREAELRFLDETQTKRNYATAIYWILPSVLTCIVLLSSFLLGGGSDGRLSSTVVFTVLATFRMIQDPVRMAPEVLSALIQAQISVARLEKFLQEEELGHDEDDRYPTPSIPAASEYVIRMDGATLGWNYPDDPTPSLSDINVVVKRREKIAVCGSVGAGKSSLLLALLGEMPKISGSITLSGASVAYVPQTAWIQSMSVRDNILFGKPFDESRYKRVLKACALLEDIKSFSHGDMTLIGERGVNMSGGQKQRIQLARAVYHDADVYLLDDPFSAVDAQTASILFHDCVMEMLKEKTVVLVTHQIEFLPSVDTILVMRGGRLQQAGSYDDLSTAGDVFQELVSAHKEGLQAVWDESLEEKVGNGGTEMDGGVEAQFKKIQKRLSREGSLTEIGGMGQVQETQRVEEEIVMVGKMGARPYIDYVHISGAYLILFLLLLFQILFSGAQLYGNLWLAQGVSDTAISSALLVAVYSIFCVVCVFAFTLRSFMIVKLGLRASKAFFEKLMHRIMKAPMAFFDATPSGRILNRTSTDISLIDLDVPFSLSNVLGTALDVVCIIIVTCIVTWQIVFIIVPALIMARYLQTYFANAADQLNRLNSVTKAPIVNSAAEAITGSAIIRAFRQVDRFKRRNLELIDMDASAYLYKFATLEWIVVRVELSTDVILVAVACLVLNQDSVSGGFTGLAVTYALALSSSLVVFVLWWCFLAINIVPVERIKQYLNLPAEAPAVIESNRPSPEWPEHGEILIENLQIRYRQNSPLVLKGISCRIEGGKKVGVVGRTGSGKTTLISALFRLVEPSGGRILIDGVDICSIGLHDLRFKLGIIPQEPVLFQGTVRTNLDPLNQYSDLDVWEALKKCQLADVIQNLPRGLDSAVSEDGANWSAGQRQLFCMGRVLLKRSKVLVLDEATASIDSATDAVVQRVIRQEFASCTVVTVAHRIPTVVDSDLVLALKDGIAMEFDSPKRLMEEKTTLFAQLVAEYWAQSSRHSGSNSSLKHDSILVNKK